MSEVGVIRVLIAEDNTMVRCATRSILENYPNIEVVGEANDGHEVVLRAEQLQPTVVVMDINMPKMDGIAATRLIKVNFPRIAIVGFSVHTDRYVIDAMLRAGAVEYVSKGKAAEELYAAVQRAVASIHPILVLHDGAGSERTPAEFAQSVQSRSEKGSSAFVCQDRTESDVPN